MTVGGLAELHRRGGRYASPCQDELFGLPLAVAIGQYVAANELRALERVAEATGLAVAADAFHGHVPGGLPDQADDVELALYDDNGALILGSGLPSPDRTFSRR